MGYIDQSQIEGLGTAGTPTGGVLTVQGAANATPQPAKIFDPSGVAIDSLNSGSGNNGLLTAIGGTAYIFSTVNQTTTQLAAGATFTGGIETIINQQAAIFLITSDRSGTLTINQYIDAAGTFKITPIVFQLIAGQQFGRTVQITGNYFNITYKNTGATATTTLNINTAFGTQPSTTSLGNGPVSLDEINGVAAGARPDGFLRTVVDPTTLLFDTFETLDTTNTWTIGGTTSPSGASGSLAVAPGTAANATSYAKSQATFIPGASAYLQFATLVQIEAGVVTGNQRFWGLGVYVTPTLTVPITNGAIYEIDTATGGLFASVYSNSVRTQTVALTRPTDGTTHRYAIYYKASRAYFEIDNVQVASIAFPNPQVSALSTVIGSVNGGSVVGSAPVLNSTLIGLGDTGRNATKLADSKYPWRQQQINADGSALTTLDANKNTYSFSGTVTAVAGVTDLITITGSATKTVRVTRISLFATQTTGTVGTVSLIKRSAANTGGTFSAKTAVPHDSNNAAATVVVNAYTANPTALGAAVGTLRTKFIAIGSPTSTNANPIIPDDFISEFGNRAAQGLILRGTSQILAINLNGGTFTGNVFAYSIEVTEE